MFNDLRNVSGDDRRLHVDGETVIVKADETLQVTPEAAGRAPAWRTATDAEVDLLLARPLAMHSRRNGEQVEVFDLGEGLLAQPDTWRPADAAPGEAAPDPLEPGTEPAADDSTEQEH
jgi:hypothetical protein